MSIKATDRYSPEDIDAAITDAARRMTSRAPSSDMRARVLDRIDDRASRNPWRFISLIAVASAVVIASSWALWPRAARSSAPVAVTIASASPDPIVAAPKPASSAASNEPHVGRVAQHTMASAAPEPELISEADREWAARAVPALAGPSAIDVQALTHPGVTITPLTIQPLVTEPLTVAALGAGNGGLK